MTLASTNQYLWASECLDYTWPLVWIDWFIVLTLFRTMINIFKQHFARRYLDYSLGLSTCEEAGSCLNYSSLERTTLRWCSIEEPLRWLVMSRMSRRGRTPCEIYGRGQHPGWSLKSNTFLLIGLKMKTPPVSDCFLEGCRFPTFFQHCWREEEERDKAATAQLLLLVMLESEGGRLLLLLLWTSSYTLSIIGGPVKMVADI